VATDETHALLGAALELDDPPSWDDGMLLEDLPGNDSLKQLAILMSIEERLGRKLTMDELIGLEAVGDVRRLLEAA
jgi:acyl carrier protein